MNRITTKQYLTWLAIATVFAVGMLSINITVTPVKPAVLPPYYLGIGWTKILGNQVYIECYESEPRSIASRGFPFAYQRTDTFCENDLAVDGFRTNKYAVIMNLIISLIVSAALLIALKAVFVKKARD